MADLISLADAKAAVGVGQNDDAKNARLAALITSVSERLEQNCGPVIYGTHTLEQHDGGCPHIYTDYTPVQGVTQVVEYDATTSGTLTAETNTTKPSTGYVFEPVSGKVIRRDTGATSRFPAGYGNVVVSYVAGRAAGTATMDAKWRTATEIALRAAWRSWEQTTAQVSPEGYEIPTATFPRFIIPNAVKELLGDEWRTGAGV